MKKAVFVLFVSFLAGCAIQSNIPKPSEEMTTKSGIRMEILQRGHVVYTTECARCHAPMMPKEVSREDWHVVVPGMAWNAGISQADEDAVLKYIMAAR